MFHHTAGFADVPRLISLLLLIYEVSKPLQLFGLLNNIINPKSFNKAPDIL